MKRVLKVSAISLGTLLLLLIAAVLFVAGTETGTRFAISRATPDFVTIEQIEGRLINRLVVHDVAIDAPTAKVTLGRVELRWALPDVLAGRLPIQLLQVDDAEVMLVPGPESEPVRAAEPFQLPSNITTPLDVGLQKLLVNNLRFQAGPDAEAVVIEKIQLAGVATGQRFEIEQLSVSSPLADVDASARVVARADWPVNVDLELTLRREGLADIQARTSVDGTVRALRVEASVAAPYNIMANAAIGELLTEPGIDAELTLDALNPSAVRADLPDATLTVHANIDGQPTDLRIRSEFSARQEDQQATGALTASLAADKLQVDSLTIEVPGQAASLAAHGQIELGATLRGEGSMSWQNLRWPLTNEPDFVSERGRIDFSGNADDYSLSSETRLTLPEILVVDAALRGNGNRDSAQVDFELGVLEGMIDGSVALSLTPSIRADVQLEATSVNPGVLAADWPGQLDLKLHADVELAEGQPRIRLQTLSARGNLRGKAVTLDTRGEYDAGTVTIDELSAATGSTRLSAKGRYAEEIDIAWSLDTNNLGDLLPSASGELTGNGVVRGTPPQIIADAEIHGKGLEYQARTIASFDLNADVDLTEQTPSTLTFSTDNVQTDTFSAEGVSLDIDGTPGSHRIVASASTSQGSASLKLGGQLSNPWSDNPLWSFALNEAMLEYPGLRPWSLDTPAEGQLSANGIEISQHCWSSNEAGLCLSARRDDRQLHAKFTLDEVGFDYFATLLPSAFELDGALSGRGEISQMTDKPLLADIEIETSAGRLALVSAAGDDDSDGTLTETLLDLEPSRLHLSLNDEAAAVDAAIELQQGKIDLLTRLAVTGQPFAERPLSGSLRMDIPDIAFLEPFLDEVERVAGSIGGQLDIGGTPAKPTISGQLGLRDGAFESAAAGVRLRELTFTLEGARDAGIRLDGSAKSGGGTLEINGDFTLGSDATTANVKVTGKDFQLLGTNEATLFVSPDLVLDADAETIDISGTVRVPQARIAPESVPESAVGVSDDVVIVAGDEDADGAVANRSLQAEVKVVLGPDVRFEGFGLKARFEGATTIMLEPEQPTTATGEIVIAEGEYRAYGQGLVIENGKIIFAGGPVTEPALDIRAVRRPQEGILVGARVRGTIKEPSFSLFSEPAMTQQEQLSWLVLGRSLEQSPSGQSSALAQASLALGVKGGKFLADNIGGNLGVDEFTIKSGSGEAGAASDPSDAALVIGKYLSPKLYLSYGIGLFSPVTVLRIQYEFNRRLKLLTESSAGGSGADLEYSFERGN